MVIKGDTRGLEYGSYGPLVRLVSDCFCFMSAYSAKQGSRHCLRTKPCS